jgi:hypothetical protein
LLAGDFGEQPLDQVDAAFPQGRVLNKIPVKKS